jgi:DNA-binding GntR family transcriptional regulator
MVTEAIRDAIVTRRLRPGERVTESSLAEQLHVSKTPVREALLRLESIGLIEAEGARGGRIVSLSADTIRHSFEIRAALEVHAARLAALHATAEAAAEVQKLATESRVASERHDVESYRTLDRRFHLAVVEAIENPRLTGLIDDAITLTWTLRSRDVPMADDSVDSAMEHETIAAAIALRDATAAADAMFEHLRTLWRIVLTEFQNELDDPAGDASLVPGMLGYPTSQSDAASPTTESAAALAKPT